jgi:hypothetical protein
MRYLRTGKCASRPISEFGAYSPVSMAGSARLSEEGSDVSAMAYRQGLLRPFTMF